MRNNASQRDNQQVSQAIAVANSSWSSFSSFTTKAMPELQSVTFPFISSRAPYRLLDSAPRRCRSHSPTDKRQPTITLVRDTSNDTERIRRNRGLQTELLNLSTRYPVDG